MENMKIEKNKTYTYEELKEIYKKAMMKTLNKPTGDSEHEKDDAKFQLSLMLSGMVILSELEKNLFEKDNEEENK